MEKDLAKQKTICQLDLAGLTFKCLAPSKPTLPLFGPLVKNMAQSTHSLR